MIKPLREHFSFFNTLFLNRFKHYLPYLFIPELNVFCLYFGMIELVFCFYFFNLFLDSGIQIKRFVIDQVMNCPIIPKIGHQITHFTDCFFCQVFYRIKILSRHFNMQHLGNSRLELFNSFTCSGIHHDYRYLHFPR